MVASIGQLVSGLDDLSDSKVIALAGVGRMRLHTNATAHTCRSDGLYTINDKNVGNVMGAVSQFANGGSKAAGGKMRHLVRKVRDLATCVKCGSLTWLLSRASA